MGKLKAPVPAPCKRSRMKGFHFKTDSSPLVRVFCTPDGRIDYSALGFEFVSDPTSIKLNGSRFPIEGLKSQHTWEEIEEFFKKEGEPVGTEEDLGASTGTSKIPNLDENVSAAFVKLTLEEMKEVAATEMKEVAATVPQRRNCKKRKCKHKKENKCNHKKENKCNHKKENKCKHKENGENKGETDDRSKEHGYGS